MRLMNIAHIANSNQPDMEGKVEGWGWRGAVVGRPGEN